MTSKWLIWICACALLSGCWNTIEINDLAAITLLGVDKQPSGEYKLSALVVDPSSVDTKSSMAGGAKTKSIVLTAKGASILTAIRKLQSVLSRRAYWAHTQAVVFGENVAREGMISSIDILSRQYQFRNQADILVTQGTAEEVLHVEPQLEGSLGAEIDGMIKYSQYTASVQVIDLSQFLEALTSDTRDPMTGRISLASQQGIELTVKGQPKQSALSLRSSAVFKGDQLTGWLDENESRGALWILGKVHGGITELPCPGHEEGTIAMEFTAATSELKPKIVSGQLEMNVKIRVDAEIGEISCPNFQLNSAQMTLLNRSLENRIQEDIDKVTDQVQKKWQSDIFGFGEAIYKKYPGEWKKLSPHWKSGGLKDLKVHLLIKANIRRSGLIDNPAQTDESR